LIYNFLQFAIDGKNNSKIKVEKVFLGREIWLSPVIQATWEARAVGWFEVERPPQEN
jgi:hypothetical protein